MKKSQAIILAAGKGTRMKSDTVKVAHHVGGKPVIKWVIDAVCAAGVDVVYCVVGHQADITRSLIDQPNVVFITQEEQLGTGHAVQMAVPYIEKNPLPLTYILAGDCPLIRPETLTQLAQHNPDAAATILSTHILPPEQYGRILRSNQGNVLGIKEAKECSADELKITEINTGAYVFQTADLITSLSQLTASNTQKEYYLTDTIHILKDSGRTVDAFCTPNDHESIGINTRHDLAKVHHYMYTEVHNRLMTEGVTLIDPSTTYIDPTAQIGADTIIHPFTTIKGQTIIESHCEIGPYAYIENETILSYNRIPPFFSSQR